VSISFFLVHLKTFEMENIMTQKFIIGEKHVS